MLEIEPRVPCSLPLSYIPSVQISKLIDKKIRPNEKSYSLSIFAYVADSVLSALHKLQIRVSEYTRR
jgi:hypothetical protein